MVFVVSFLFCLIFGKVKYIKFSFANFAIPTVAYSRYNQQPQL